MRSHVVLCWFCGVFVRASESALWVWVNLETTSCRGGDERAGPELPAGRGPLQTSWIMNAVQAASLQSWIQLKTNLRSVWLQPRPQLVEYCVRETTVWSFNGTKVVTRKRENTGNREVGVQTVTEPKQGRETNKSRKRKNRGGRWKKSLSLGRVNQWESVLIVRLKVRSGSNALLPQWWRFTSSFVSFASVGSAIRAQQARSTQMLWGAARRKSFELALKRGSHSVTRSIRSGRNLRRFLVWRLCERQPQRFETDSFRPPWTKDQIWFTHRKEEQAEGEDEKTDSAVLWKEGCCPTVFQQHLHLTESRKWSN